MSQDTEYFCACKGMWTMSTDECAYCMYKEPRIMQVSMNWRSAESAGLGDPQADVRTPSGATRNGRSGRSEAEEQPILRGEEGCPTLRGGAAQAADAATFVSCGKCGNDTGQCNCYLEDL